MRISELVEAVAPIGTTTDQVGTNGLPPTTPGQTSPPGQPPTTPGQTPPSGQPPTTPGQPSQPTLGNQQPNATTAAPSKPSPEVQQDMKSMSDQFNALKLKYDELQKQILNPAVQV